MNLRHSARYIVQEVHTSMHAAAQLAAPKGFLLIKIFLTPGTFYRLTTSVDPHVAQTEGSTFFIDFLLQLSLTGSLKKGIAVVVLCVVSSRIAVVVLVGATNYR